MDDDAQRTALARLIDASGESLTALSRLIGRNDAYLQQYLRRGSPRRLPEAERGRLARYLSVPESALGGPVVPAAVAVPRLDLAAAAGRGALADDAAMLAMTSVPADLLRALRLDAATLAFLRVQGESMEPLLAPGDEILVNRADRRITHQPRLMVARVDGALVVKRIALAPAGVRLISEHPAWPPVDLAPDAVEPVGRVVWMTRLF
ncbi:S24 family peptidase [Sphingomonas sp. BGYR3]|uniref:S24 family peptidase n=1 Tax=Sphingomonas sp. BGYR3 TaxID=2975483 RepID=UPI0021A9293E|nr:S24 family peptidase [Sphingomonas sp. BGYR3]MDG5489817.1 S24 family peptidase [Sphingomonas sp. BGYR3]